MAINDRPANLTPSVAWALLSPIGRISRQAYWLGMFVVWIVILIAMNMWWGSLDPSTPLSEVDINGFAESNPLFPLLFFALQWVELALVIKRCQDIGVTGFVALLILVPLVNVITVLVLGFIRSVPGPNRYGPEPNSYYRRKA
ncbi:DUF805 domain-containing protein [Roseibium aggregatum]|uniref:DUF805 domain-containing protein n=1 Tax=Roseibium aggregatum TaxID=187304 RepID=A0A926NWZ3_9HYPH|nr:DUF805 domain-containing protein [Roseibium aggregatum]MBD1544738.1 DUF805 domain-containing protein [Roseibium aggregatum]